MKRIALFSLSLTAIIFIIGCSKPSVGNNSTPDPCTGLTVKFSADVQPIVNTTCAISSGCHATGSTNAGGPFTDYNKIFAKSADIKSQIQAGLMPQTGSLTTDQKNKIICWINSGSPNN